MDAINELNERYSGGDAIRFGCGRGNLPRALITTDQASAEIYLHGAHVTAFEPRDQNPVLFLSENSFFQPDKSIRGGVPVIFPWFGQLNDDRTKMHGFVRHTEWKVSSVQREPSGAVALTLATASTAATRDGWAHDFELSFTVTIPQSLEMSLQVRNTSSRPLTFEEALHT